MAASASVMTLVQFMFLMTFNITKPLLQDLHSLPLPLAAAGLACNVGQ